MRTGFTKTGMIGKRLGVDFEINLKVLHALPGLSFGVKDVKATLTKKHTVAFATFQAFFIKISAVYLLTIK